MEELSWFFNSDFEERLFTDQFSKIHSTKSTQEFEYFVNYLDPKALLYTSKIYSMDFKSRFQKLTGVEFRTTLKPQNVKMWCQEYLQVELLKKYQNKINTLMYFFHKGLINHQVEEIQNTKALEPGYLYKNPFSLSGIGHYEYPQDSSILERLLNKHSLIKEEKLNRVRDISTLVCQNQILSIYENEVDKFFQYKGTIVGPSPFESLEEKKHYLGKIEIVMDYVKDYTGIYSIDSFYYLKDGRCELQPVSELNMRKTMGYTAVKLKEFFFPDYKYAKLQLIRNKKIPKELPNSILWLSPIENLFHAFLIGANSRDELQKSQELLTTALL